MDNFMNDIFYFAFTSLIVIISLYIILKILIKRFDPEKSKVKLYGILQGMSNREIISISCSLVTYIFMIYLIASFLELNWTRAIIVILLTLFSDILVRNKILNTTVNLGLSAISLGGIQIVHIIHQDIEEFDNVWMLLLLVFVMIFLFLYLSYTLLKNLKTVIIANKYIRKGGNNENKKRS